MKYYEVVVENEIGARSICVQTTINNPTTMDMEIWLIDNDKIRGDEEVSQVNAMNSSQVSKWFNKEEIITIENL